MSTTKSPVRVGVAGLGRSGWNHHCLVTHSMPDKFTLVAVTDPNQQRCQEAENQLSCKSYPTLETLLAEKDIDLVVLATPSHFHHDQTINAFNAGKHVLVEKPMAGNIAEADEMIEASHKANRLLTVFQHQRYAPSFQKVQEVIKSGKLGRIVEIRIAIQSFGRRWDWQTLKSYNGGELNNTGAHFIDMAHQIVGMKELDIFCNLQRTLTCGDAEDHVKIIMQAKGAPLIDLEITKACPYPQAPWLIMGTAGGLTGTFEKLNWKYVDFSKMPVRVVDTTPTPDRSYNSEKLDWTEEEWQIPSPAPDTRVCFYTDLYKTLRENAPLAVTPESIRQQNLVIDRCRQLCPFE